MLEPLHSEQITDLILMALPHCLSSPARSGSRDKAHGIFHTILGLFLENSYDNRNVVHVTAGSFVPLLKNSVWFVIRGMICEDRVSLSVHGDELVLGLVGPNEPFGAAFTNVEAYEAVALTDCDLLCCNLAELRAVSSVTLGLAKAMAARYRQAESLLKIPAGAASRRRTGAGLSIGAARKGLWRTPCEILYCGSTFA